MAGDFAHHVNDEDDKVGAKNGEDGTYGFVEFGKSYNSVIGFKNKKEYRTKYTNNKRITKKTAISRDN